jgi:hypothetical protein
MVLDPGELPPPLHDAKRMKQMSFACERMYLISMYLFRRFQERATRLRTVILQSIGLAEKAQLFRASPTCRAGGLGSRRCYGDLDEFTPLAANRAVSCYAWHDDKAQG